jgi:hypothetical protein
MNSQSRQDLDYFAKQNHIAGLSYPSLAAVAEQHAGYDVATAKQFLSFQDRINDELLQHSIITQNRFTEWFAKGEQSKQQIKAFVVQFSVFSNLFLIAQLKKTINAESLQSMRASKEILANEIGVIFKSSGGLPQQASNDADTDPELVSTQGSIEGGQFRFQAAHFEWLLRLSEKLGLGFNDVGKRRHGTKSTLHFCDELSRLYGSEDYFISQAASYAVENWAAAGFWKQLIQGFKLFNEKYHSDLPLAFFTWHDRIEAQHALHTQEELEEIYFNHAIQEDAFIRYGNEMLEGVAVFWDGLDALRRELN